MINLCCKRKYLICSRVCLCLCVHHRPKMRQKQRPFGQKLKTIELKRQSKQLTCQINFIVPLIVLLLSKRHKTKSKHQPNLKKIDTNFYHTREWGMCKFSLLMLFSSFYLFCYTYSLPMSRYISLIHFVYRSDLYLIT